LSVIQWGFALYQLTAADVMSIKSRRSEATGRFSGSVVSVGMAFPLLLTAFTPTGGINGQVFLDGNDSLWVTNVVEGTGPGTWQAQP
jgi:hypothetical protein